MYINIVLSNESCLLVTTFPSGKLKISPHILFVGSVIPSEFFRQFKFQSTQSYTNFEMTSTANAGDPRPKRPLINESMNLRRSVAYMEAHRGTIHTLGNICQEFNLKRRVLYDFTSIMEKFGCCTRVSNEKFTWNGLNYAKDSILNLEKQCANIEDEQDILKVLDCSKDSSLPHIALAIIALFLHMKVPTLNIKEVCAFFCPNPGRYQTMLRKLYTVASRLEVGGLLARTANSAEIKIVKPTRGEADCRSMSISDIMNTASELQMQKRYAQRRELFQACQSMTTEKSSSSSSSCPSSTQPSASECPL